MKAFILGTRGSDLALAQTRAAAAQLSTLHPALCIEERIIRTTGDARLDIDLSAPGSLDKGLFTGELEAALQRGEIDAAVHSLKDLPTIQPAGLTLGAVLRREDPADMLISRIPGGIEALPNGARVATSSLRRKRFLLWQRPDLEVVVLRGNVPTRIRKLAEDPALSAIVLAAAGLNRLEAAGISLGLAGFFVGPLDFMLPAPGQGAVAVQCREDSSAAQEVLSGLHDADTAVCVNAERAVLAGLGGGCHLPLGALATVDSAANLHLKAAWFGEGEMRAASGQDIPSNWMVLAERISQELQAPV